MSGQMSKERLLEMGRQKDAMEKEIAGIVEYLESTPVGVTGSLMDSQGFPLNDVELIISVRTSRNRLAMLRNDLKDLRAAIYEGLQSLHQSNAVTSEPHSEVPPLCKIGEVLLGSPAEEAGLMQGDVIVSVEGVAAHSSLATIAQVVSAARDSQLAVTVQRGTQSLQLTLRPHAWPPGKGILGCRLLDC